MRAAIYARYSSDMQKPESIEDQTRQCRKLIAARSWHVAEGCEFSDFAQSGADDTRLGYHAMKEAAKAGRFDCLVVDDLSRLGRDTVESLLTYEELTNHGVQIVGVADGIDTTSGNGKVPYYFRAVMSELFLDELRSKMRRGLDGRVLRGYSAGGRVYGYEYEDVPDPSCESDRFGRPKRLGVSISIDNEQAKVVHLIFGLRAKGFGLKAIAHRLNEQEIPAPRHKRLISAPGSWCTGTIRALLRNPKYVGDWSWGKTKWVRSRGTKKRRPVSQSKDKWTACFRPELRIIDQLTWDKIQELNRADSNVIREPSGRLAGSRTNSGPAKYLFSGLLKCGKCGGSMIVVTSGGYSSYVCNNYWNRGTTVCTNRKRLPRRVVESDLLSGIQSALLDDRLIEGLVSRVNALILEGHKSEPTDIRALAEDAKRIETEIDNLLSFIAGGDTSNRVRSMLADREAKLTTIRRQIQTAKSSGPKGSTIDPQWVRNRTATLRRLFGNFAEDTLTARMELANVLGDKIEVKPVEGKKGWEYLAKGILKPGNIFADYPFQDSVIALRGFDRELAQAISVKIRLKAG